MWIGPNTDIYTVTHPVNAVERRKYLAKVLPVTIGNDVWLCGKVTICPGVTIGNNVVVAAGSVVIRDVPDNIMVAGNPAKVVGFSLKPDEIIEHEKALYSPDERLSIDKLEKNYNKYFINRLMDIRNFTSII